MRKTAKSQYSKTYQGPGKTNTHLSRRTVVNRIIALQERIPINEIQSFSTRCTKVRYYQVDAVRVSTDESIQGTRENLGVGVKWVCFAADVEYEGFKIFVLGGGNFE